MQSFASVFTELAFDLASELRATGRADIASELEACTVKTISYDPETDAGLVALQPQRALSALERDVIGQKLGQVIPFSGARYACLQLDNFGRLVALCTTEGIEVAAQAADFCQSLKGSVKASPRSYYRVPAQVPR